MKFKITILRLGHRLGRDKRISTHLGLVARAFGANEIIYVGDVEKDVLEKINDVTKRWGGSFSVSIEKSYKDVISKWKEKRGLIIHLTMYGINISRKIIKEIKEQGKKHILIIVGAKKVPREIYEIADYNIAIGNQPHSEISALAIFLDRFFNGKELNRAYKNAKIKIIPQARGKKVIKLS